MHLCRRRFYCWLLLSLTLFIATASAGDRDRDRTRIPWTGQQLRGTAEPAPPFCAIRVWPKLEVKAPVYLRAEPGSQRLLVVDHKAGGSEPVGLSRSTIRLIPPPYSQYSRPTF
ncbi:MAG UNVERIFIED_CONTAM: hypothetical protein LVR18_06405 [Planctomycetaceae bacterium]